MKKRLLSSFLALVMLLGTVPSTAFAADDEPAVILDAGTPNEVVGGEIVGDEVIGGEDVSDDIVDAEPSNEIGSGFCGADENGDGKPDDNLRWSLRQEYVYDETGELIDIALSLTISGSGAMMDYSIDSYAPAPWFDRGHIRRVSLPEGLTHIGNFAFFACYFTEPVDIPSTVTSIGMGAFYAAYNSDDENIADSQLLTITIPASVSSIGIGAFSANALVKAFAVENGNNNFCAVDGVLFEAHAEKQELDPMFPAVTVMVPDTLLLYPTAKPGTSYSVPYGVTAIASAAFDDQSVHLRRLTFPASVETISDYAFSYFSNLWLHFYGDAPDFADSAFSGAELLCTYLNYAFGWSEATGENAAYGGDNIVWEDVDKIGVVDSGYCGAATEEDPYGQNLTWTLILDGTLTIEGSGAMMDFETEAPWDKYAQYISAVALPEGLTNIGSYAFNEFRHIETIDIPGSVTVIGDHAFAYCTALSALDLPANLTEIGEYAFSFCAALTEVTIPTKVTHIGERAFFYCRKLRTAKLSSSMTTINKSVFSNCTALTDVTIPNGITEIGEYAFSSCTALTEITLPDSVVTIGSSAFSGSYNLAAVHFGSGLKTIGSSAFGSCSSLKVITLPNSVETIGDHAFSASGLTLASFGTGLTTLGTEAFYDTDLAVVKFTGNKPQIGDRIFYQLSPKLYYPSDNSTWSSYIPSTKWGSATQLTLIGTTDNTAPELTNVFAKTATDANLKWQAELKGMLFEYDGNMLLQDLQSAYPEAGYEKLSDVVTLYWTCPEEVSEYTWRARTALNTAATSQAYNIRAIDVPVMYAVGPAYMVAIVDEGGNISWELARLETNDLTAPAISEDEEGISSLTAVLNSDGEVVLSWDGVSADTLYFMPFIDTDEDGMLNMSAEAGLSGYVLSEKDGRQIMTLPKSVCEDFDLKANSTVSLILTDGAWNMAVYSAKIPSNDSEKPEVELTAEPTTAGGKVEAINIDIEATDNVGVKKVTLGWSSGIRGGTLKTWTINKDDEVEWNDSYRWDVSGLSSGEYELTVTVTDASDNEQSKTVSLTVDNTAPSAGELTAEAEGKTVTLSWSGTADNLDTITVYRAYRDPVVGTEFAPVELAVAEGNTFTDDDRSKPDGEYSYYLVLTDALGNSTTTDTVMVLVDTDAPELNVYDAPDNKSRVWGTVSFGVSSSDVLSQVASVTVEWSCGELNLAEPLQHDTYSIDTLQFTDGDTLTVTVTAKDHADNSAEPVTLTYTIANYPKASTDLTAEIADEGILLSWKASNPEDNVEKYIMLRAVADENGVLGNYEAIDTNIGKITLTSVIAAVVRDYVEAALKDAVEQELTAIANGSQSITIGEILASMDGYGLSDAAKSALEALSCTYIDTDVEPGATYSYKLVAQSFSGLVAESEPTEALTFTDNAAPVVNTVKALNELGTALFGGKHDKIVITVDASDLGGGTIDRVELQYPYSKNGSAQSGHAIFTQAFTIDISEWDSGTYTFTATAYDNFENASAPAQITVTVDNTAPDAPANVSAESFYDKIRLTWSGDAALVAEGGSYRIERDGETVGTCDGRRVYFDDPVTDNAEHSYRVVAVDVVGNETAAEIVKAAKSDDAEVPVVVDVWPQTGYTLCHDAQIQVSAADDGRVSKIEFGYSLNGGETVWFDPVEANSSAAVAEFDWDISALSGTATLYFKVTDAAGRTAQRSESVTIMAYTAPAKPSGLTASAGFKSSTLSWNEGDTTLLKQFKIYRVVNGGEVLLTNLSGNTYTVTGLTEATVIRVAAEDIYGAVSPKAEITVTPETTETEPPVAVILPKVLTGVPGTPVTFSGINSTDNDAVKTYAWDFGDGSSGSGALCEHTYAAAGEYTVKLTVTDNSGNSAQVSGTVTVYDISGDNATHALLTVTVTDGYVSNTPLLEGVTVTVTNDEGFETSSLTGREGTVTLVVPHGPCTVMAIKKGYSGAVRNINVTSDMTGTASLAIAIGQSGVEAISGSLTAERMTYEEIKAAGIDVTDPANNHVVKQEFALRFVATPEIAFDIPVASYVNSSGKCVGGSGFGWGTYVRYGGTYKPMEGTSQNGPIPNDSVSVGIFPVGKSYYLVIYGETHWMKEMFHVELILANNSFVEDVEDCIATLELPEGLSLAAMLDYGQSERVSVGTIEKAVDVDGTAQITNRQVSWYVRGDAMGEYYLTASVIGNFVDANRNKTPFTTEFETDKPIKVYAGSALHLTVTAQDTAYSEKEYRVQFKLENVSHTEDPAGIGIDLYNLSFGLTGAEQYSCIIWSDGTETRFEDLDREDFGDKMTFRVPVLKPGQAITINYVTTCLFESDLASALVDKVTLGTMEIAFRLTNVFVTTLEGSTTEIPTTVIFEPVPKATFTEWLWVEIKDAFKGTVKDSALQAIDAFFFAGVPIAQYGVKVFEVGSDLLEDTHANSKAIVTISEGAYFLDSDNLIHSGDDITIDPSLYNLRRSSGGVMVYTDAEHYTISEDGKTMTINGNGNLYLLRTGDTGDVSPEVNVTTEYLVSNPDYDPASDPESDKYLKKTFTRTLKEPVQVDGDGNVVTDADGNPVLQTYSPGLITATDITLLPPTSNTLEIPTEGTAGVTFPHFMTDGEGTVAIDAQNVVWTLTDSEGSEVAEGMDLTGGVLTIDPTAQPGTYTVTLSIAGTEISASRSISVTGEPTGGDGGNTPGGDGGNTPGGDGGNTPGGNTPGGNIPGGNTLGASGSGSTSSGYQISVEAGKNGTVSIGGSRVSAGDTVTLTVTPAADCELGHLSVSDGSGREIELTPADDGTYTFKMPASNVTIEASFHRCAVKVYTDVEHKHWYHDAVDYVLEKGLIDGASETTFDPEGLSSRAVLVEALWRSEGCPTAEHTMSYSDVDKDTRYSEAICWASSVGIVDGFPDGTFRPDEDITREQMAAIFYRYEKLKGQGFEDDLDYRLPYGDAEQVADWALESVCWNTREGLLEGDGVNFDPKGTATRAHISQLLMNYFERTEQ